MRFIQHLSQEGASQTDRQHARDKTSEPKTRVRCTRNTWRYESGTSATRCIKRSKQKSKIWPWRIIFCLLSVLSRISESQNEAQDVQCRLLFIWTSTSDVWTCNWWDQRVFSPSCRDFWWRKQHEIKMRMKRSSVTFLFFSKYWFHPAKESLSHGGDRRSVSSRLKQHHLQRGKLSWWSDVNLRLIEMYEEKTYVGFFYVWPQVSHSRTETYNVVHCLVNESTSSIRCSTRKCRWSFSSP